MREVFDIFHHHYPLRNISSILWARTCSFDMEIVIARENLRPIEILWSKLFSNCVIRLYLQLFKKFPISARKYLNPVSLDSVYDIDKRLCRSVIRDSIVYRRVISEQKLATRVEISAANEEEIGFVDENKSRRQRTGVEERCRKVKSASLCQGVIMATWMLCAERS